MSSEGRTYSGHSCAAAGCILPWFRRKDPLSGGTSGEAAWSSEEVAEQWLLRLKSSLVMGVIFRLLAKADVSSFFSDKNVR